MTGIYKYIKCKGIMYISVSVKAVRVAYIFHHNVTKIHNKDIIIYLPNMAAHKVI